jgi:Lipase (class 3)
MDIDDAPELFCLAVLTYRGFADAMPTSEDTLGPVVERGLRDLPPLAGRWELAWGPESWRSGLSQFDDAALYVARAVDRPDRYVVAIRGTNPVSGLDWLLGDLWVRMRAPWRYGGARPGEAPAVSLSTALGLRVLQALRSSGARAGPSALGPPEPGTRRGASAAQGLDGPVADLERAGTSLLERARRVWRQLRARDARYAGLEADPEAQVGVLLAEWTDAPQTTLIGPVASALEAAHHRFDAGLFAALGDELGAGSRLRAGDDLRAFLARALREAHGPVEVVVTGHSKGGALACAVALWLAETQGPGVPAAARWDPAARARVQAFSFAGPTAGNRDFARRCDEVLGEHCLRFANDLDVVPHAWAPDEMRRIPDLYGRGVAPVPGLRPLVDAIADKVEPLAYGHGGRLVPLAGKVSDRYPTFVGQMVHQHLDAYLAALGLESVANTWTFLDPLA